MEDSDIGRAGVDEIDKVKDLDTNTVGVNSVDRAEDPNIGTIGIDKADKEFKIEELDISIAGVEIEENQQ